jgi:hypothetical protein
MSSDSGVVRGSDDTTTMAPGPVRLTSGTVAAGGGGCQSDC